DIHFLERLAFVVDARARNDLETVDERFSLLAAVGLDHADNDVVAVLPAGAGGLQHRIGLADAGRGADENAQPSGTRVLAPGGFEQGFRRRPLVEIAICHPVRRLLGSLTSPRPCPAPGSRAAR